MKKFFTSDFHLGSGYVFTNGHRETRSVHNVYQMNNRIIDECNKRCTSDDIIYHIGDFCNRNNDRGIECLNTTALEYLKKINANVVLLKGNHDENNKVPVVCNYLVTNIGSFQNVTLTHYPSFMEENKIEYKQRTINICGHVHQSWQSMYDYNKKVLNINVGIDAWHFTLIDEYKLYQFIKKILDEHKRKKNLK